MSTLEIRKLLIDQVQSTDNLELLHEMLRFWGINPPAESPTQFTAAQKARIEGAREAYRTGQYFSNEEVDAEMDQWLSE